MAAFVSIGALAGYGSGDGFVWGAVGGFGLWGLILICAVAKLAFEKMAAMNEFVLNGLGIKALRSTQDSDSDKK
ncbi:hypothetical protein KUL72_02370 [Bradyrhizobium arachidis]|uniref:hypothetical protein n=1 Tax=Bradyrhizobium TaxID=374 RepID=UPI0021630A03|nr:MULTISPECIES: hypothetical protein [Bradyrhizobium]MDN4986613.1 hypothetical protein [Bradyrhizobium sp. WYCCWR 13022]UVO37269.1 hypothetical protein KUL72_02370 [Bradyrhizobium arachidis]